MKPIHIPSCQTLSEFFYSPLSSLSLVSSKVVRICQQTTPVHVLTSRKLCGTNLRTKVLDCLALLCFLLAGLTYSVSQSFWKTPFVPGGIKLLLFPRRLPSYFFNIFFFLLSRIALDLLNAIYQLPAESSAGKANSISFVSCQP